jgi:hypothetical protein
MLQRHCHLHFFTLLSPCLMQTLFELAIFEERELLTRGQDSGIIWNQYISRCSGHDETISSGLRGDVRHQLPDAAQACLPACYCHFRIP